MKVHGLVEVGIIVTIMGIAFGCASTPRKVLSVPAEITSTPTGATVKLDGCVLGTTPFSTNICRKTKLYSTGIVHKNTADLVNEFQRLADSQVYYFLVTKEGYRPLKVSLDVDAGVPRRLHFSLPQLDSPITNGTTGVQYENETTMTILK
jgi:hypothetical protein